VPVTGNILNVLRSQNCKIVRNHNTHSTSTYRLQRH